MLLTFDFKLGNIARIIDQDGNPINEICFSAMDGTSLIGNLSEIIYKYSCNSIITNNKVYKDLEEKINEYINSRYANNRINYVEIEVENI